MERATIPVFVVDDHIAGCRLSLIGARDLARSTVTFN
jgi:hypothetical protein